MQIPHVNLETIADPATREVVRQLRNLIETLAPIEPACHAALADFRRDYWALCRAVAERIAERSCNPALNPA